MCVDAAEALAERGVKRAGREHAELGSLRAAGRDVPRRRCSRPACRCCRSRRRSRSDGSATPTTAIGIDRFGVSAPGNVVLEQARHQRRPRRRAGARRCIGRDEDDSDSMTRLQRLSRGARPEPVARQPEAQLPHVRPAGRLRDRGIRGLTSNPTIFQKAIQGSADYDEQFRQLAADEHPDARRLLGDGVRRHPRRLRRARLACTTPVRRRSTATRRSRSTPASPTTSTAPIDAARDLHQRLDRRNLMVKIPATAEGVPAIRQMISEGRNINVTLIFSLDRYAEVMEAYISGLERIAADPTPICRGWQASPASSSPVSTPRSTAGSRRSAPSEALALRGKAAVAQGKLAYRLFRETFSGERWEALAARGARVQRPLWASTATKNPAYSDVAVRRQSDRSRHRQHAARGDDRGVRGPRHAAPHGRRRPRRGRAGLGGSWPTSASTWTTSAPGSSAKASTPSRRASTS